MADGGPVTKKAPEAGVFRVARGPDPLAIRPSVPSSRTTPGQGNRWDSPDGTYGVFYFASSIEACFGETLARFRPKPQLAELVKAEWEAMGVMAPGQIPRDWRERRTVAQVDIDSPRVYLDVDEMDTHQHLRGALALGLSSLGHDDLDISHVRGPDRRLTQMISQWTYNQVDANGAPCYAGIRYRSRLCDDWECWATFDDVPMQVLRVESISDTNEDLIQIAKRFELRIF